MRELEVEVEDEDFLSQVAAAEAEALSAKRRKIDTATQLPKAQTNDSPAAEGAYTAALKGSRSLSFHHQQSSNRSIGPLKPSLANNQILFANPQIGSCFKCGKSGHWSRDCDSNSNSNSNSYASIDSSVAEKACPCGLGACTVLTANTEKNRGRKFYKCPLKEENGGCGFFEWCDKNIGTDNMTVRSQSYVSKPLIPDLSILSCPCGAGSCLILTAKTGKNIGQPFYRCPKNQGSSCGFFKWCHDHRIADSTSIPVNTSTVYKKNEMSNRSFDIRSGSSSFRCGRDGHWSKDCLMPSIQNPADQGGNSASSGTCYKCGTPGHWAKDCSFREDIWAHPR